MFRQLPTMVMGPARFHCVHVLVNSLGPIVTTTRSVLPNRHRWRLASNDGVCYAVFTLQATLGAHSCSSEDSAARNVGIGCVSACRADVIEKRCGCMPFWLTNAWKGSSWLLIAIPDRFSNPGIPELSSNWVDPCVGLGWVHYTNTYTHPFNGPLSGTTRVSRHQEGKSNVDFTEASDGEWQWHPLGHMQVCTSVQLDNHTRLFRANYVILPGVWFPIPKSRDWEMLNPRISGFKMQPGSRDPLQSLV